MARKPRIFISAVSGELGTVRQALAVYLTSLGQEPVWQEAFEDTDALTLQKHLHAKVDSCDAVICLLGRRSGAYPPALAALRYPNLLPGALPQASYTQWEYFFARELNKPVRLFRADDSLLSELAARAEPAATPREPPAPVRMAPRWWPFGGQSTPAPALTAPVEADHPDRQAAFVAWLTDQGLLYIEFRNQDHLHAEAGKLRWPFAKVVGGVRQPVTLLPSLEVMFKGRDQVLVSLRDSLTRQTRATPATVILAMGGAGKTRTATEYAWAHRDEYAALLYVWADTPAMLDHNLSEMVDILDLPAAAETDPHIRLNAVRTWLGNNADWLLILDNLDTEDARDAALMRLGELPGGHVVLTSRLDAGFWPGVERLELPALDPGDAASFLLDSTAALRVKRPDDAAAARDLAADLGDLPLALTLAGATIEQRRCDFAEYHTLWRNAREEVRGWDKKTIPGYHSAVGQAWRTSVNLISCDARILLERLAFLSPDPIPDSLLDGEIPGAPPLNARNALLDLAKYSLVSREPEAKRFSVHRLIQDATRYSLAPATSRDRLTEALWWLNAAFTGHPEDPRNWRHQYPLVLAGVAVARAADEAGIQDPTVRMLIDFGWLYCAQARYADGEPLVRRAMAIAGMGTAGPHPLFTLSLALLGGLLQATNRLAEAEPLYRRALAIDEASLGADHPDVATGLNNLATLLQATNRLAEAEPLIRRALAIDEASLGGEHPNVATGLNNLALLLQDTNRLAEAEPLMRRALTIDETSLGADHPNVAAGLNNLAGLLQATNRLAEAEPLIRRAIGIDEASLGTDHPSVATGLNNLAQLLQDTNRLAEAEPLLRRALAINEASLGAEHPDVAACLSNLARLLQDTNRLAEAMPLIQRAVSILALFEARTGHTHPDSRTIFAVYENMLQAQGHDEAAIGAAVEDVRRAAAQG